MPNSLMAGIKINYPMIMKDTVYFAGPFFYFGNFRV